jgi:lipooligosaccharide transport system permease protein
VLVSAAFSAMALCITSFLRKVQDFDLVMGLLVMPMFLFSGTFFPLTQFPEPLQWLVRALPLYHAIELLRQLTTGAVNATLALHIIYLALLGVFAFVVAMQRLERTLVK